MAVYMYIIQWRLTSTHCWIVTLRFSLQYKLLSKRSVTTTDTVITSKTEDVPYILAYKTRFWYQNFGLLEGGSSYKRGSTEEWTFLTLLHALSLSFHKPPDRRPGSFSFLRLCVFITCFTLVNETNNVSKPYLLRGAHNFSRRWCEN